MNRCTSVDRIGIGLELGLPLIKAGVRNSCHITDNAAGHALVLTGWALQALAWAFASLFVAGFTSESPQNLMLTGLAPLGRAEDC
ncbi:hypothetical protein [Streptomyces sp. SD15]